MLTTLLVAVCTESDNEHEDQHSFAESRTVRAYPDELAVVHPFSGDQQFEDSSTILDNHHPAADEHLVTGIQEERLRQLEEALHELQTQVIVQQGAQDNHDYGLNQWCLLCIAYFLGAATLLVVFVAWALA